MQSFFVNLRESIFKANHFGSACLKFIFYEAIKRLIFFLWGGLSKRSLLSINQSQKEKTAPQNYEVQKNDKSIFFI